MEWNQCHLLFFCYHWISSLQSPGSFHLILTSVQLHTVDQIRLLVLKHSGHFLYALSVLLSFLPLAGCFLFSPTAVISYHCKSPHHFFFRFQVLSLSSSLSLLHLFLASLLTFYLVPSHCRFCCHLPRCFSSFHWLADMSALYISCFH